MSVRADIEQHEQDLTPTERKIAAAVLSDYPFSGLEPIQAMGDKLSVSPPTITRFVKKLGFKGFQQFQRRLIGELREGQPSPLELHAHEQRRGGNDIAGFVAATTPVISSLPDSLSDVQVKRVCLMLADRRRTVHTIGGRISDIVAQCLSRHLMQFRPGVHPLLPDPETWPNHLLQLRPRDVLFVVDFRRYQANLARLAAQADRQKACVILVTDKWLSPIAEHATEVLAIPIDNGTAWDSYAGAIVLVESMIDRIAELDWTTTHQRVTTWDEYRPPAEHA